MRSCVLACAVFLAVATPASGAADAGKLYGGGHLTGGSGGAAIKGSALVRTVVGGDGTTAPFAVEASARCGFARIKIAVPVAADGTFSASKTGHETADDGSRHTASVTIAGRFDGRTATGSFDLAL